MIIAHYRTYPEIGPGHRRWSQTPVASAGGDAGSLVGGVLTEYLTWRATLLINLPIGALAMLGALRAFPGSSS